MCIFSVLVPTPALQTDTTDVCGGHYQPFRTPSAMTGTHLGLHLLSYCLLVHIYANLLYCEPKIWAHVLQAWILLSFCQNTKEGTVFYTFIALKYLKCNSQYCFKALYKGYLCSLYIFFLPKYSHLNPSKGKLLLTHLGLVCLLACFGDRVSLYCPCWPPTPGLQKHSQPPW